MSSGYGNRDNDSRHCQLAEPPTTLRFSAEHICNNAQVSRGSQRGAAVFVVVATIAMACRRSGDENRRTSPPPSGDEDVMMAPPPSVPSAAPLVPGDTEEARRMRHRLVSTIEGFDLPWDGGRRWSPRVLDALRAVPRHLFMPRFGVAAAYRDVPYPIGHGQTISQPTVVALMTQALHLTGSERVLEIGTGSGYQSAVLSVLAKEVYTIEVVAPLGEAAKQRLARLGYDNVKVRIGDGYAGWPEHAPFDRIIVTAAPPELPPALVAQLAEGGVIVAPVGGDEQDLVRWVKHDGELDKTVLGAVRFVPMVPGK